MILNQSELLELSPGTVSPHADCWAQFSLFTLVQLTLTCRAVQEDDDHKEFRES